MSFSNILALVEILVTILFGYYITHRVGVRDTRTRSVKELYLGQLAKIKQEVDAFFEGLFDGRLNWREIADWYGHQQNTLTCFDEGLRMALPIRKAKIDDIVNEIHEEITGSDFFNDNFLNQYYVLNAEERIKMTVLKTRVDKVFNEYVVQINNSRQYYFWETIKQKYHFETDYNKHLGKKHPGFRAILSFGLKVLPYLAITVLLAFMINKTYQAYQNNIVEEKQKQDVYDKSVNRLFDGIDSLNNTLKAMTSEKEMSVVADSCILDIISKTREIENQVSKGSQSTVH